MQNAQAYDDDLTEDRAAVAINLRRVYAVEADLPATVGFDDLLRRLSEKSER